MSSLLSSNNGKEEKEFSRRAFIIGAAQGGVIALLGARLGWLQLAQGQHYTMLSDKNRIDLKRLPPLRGQIFDRAGKPIAINQQNFRVLITPEQAPSPQAALKTLQDLIKLNDNTIEKALDNIKRVAKFTSVEIADQLTWEDLSKIEVNIHDLPGIQTDVGTIREYPLKEASAHLVGYVGAPSQDDLAKDRIYSLPGFKSGKTGIERQYERALQGKTGIAHVEVNVTGREVHELKRQSEVAGQDLYLTIDSELQSYVQKRLSQHVSGSAIVMDAHTGALYAMASCPSFDPNLFVRGLSQRTWDSLLKTQGKPMNNKAISGLYPPASTFKMVTALAALQEGIINRRTVINCQGHYDYKGQRFHCWKGQGHQNMTLKSALAESCDTYFYKIATEIGIEKIAATARSLGFGTDFKGLLPENRAGLIPDKNWKMGHLGQVWRPGDTIVSSIGQGSLQATPLQIAVMTARLINGGFAVEPSLVHNTSAMGHTSPKWPRLPFKKSHLRYIAEGLDATVNSRKGTAYKSRLEDPELAFAGKTGTAQVKRITAAQRAAGIKNEDLPWKQRHHALFTGYAPLKNPRYVCSVVIEHGVSGSAAAAPVARDILQKAQELAPHKISRRV